MKKMLCGLALLVLAAQLPLWSYDQSPNYLQIVPEAIWAAATGGGTWVTEIQVTVFEANSSLVAYFYYNGGKRGPIILYEGLPQYRTIRYNNILGTLGAFESGVFDYYGRVGTLMIFDPLARPIAVQAKIINGNYGKTRPGLSFTKANSVALGRPMFIQDLAQHAACRTSVGIFNMHTTESYTLKFTIYNTYHEVIGSQFYKSIGPEAFMSFNPFAEAGVGSGLYNNCWLEISAIGGGDTELGVFCYGSGANNYTNDTYALIARPRF
jgi:hypothetical protein